MGMRKTFHQWWKQLWLNVDCLTVGHGPIILIEEYSRLSFLKFFNVNHEKKLVVCPKMYFKIKGKVKCEHCGRLSLGVIVKDGYGSTIHNAL